jgi:hypothetical protein
VGNWTGREECNGFAARGSMAISVATRRPARLRLAAAAGNGEAISASGKYLARFCWPVAGSNQRLVALAQPPAVNCRTGRTLWPDVPAANRPGTGVGSYPMESC